MILFVILQLFHARTHFDCLYAYSLLVVPSFYKQGGSSSKRLQLSNQQPFNSGQSDDVNDVLGKVFDILKSTAPSTINGDAADADTVEPNLEDLKWKFDKLLNDIKRSSRTETEKMFLVTEANLTITDLFFANETPEKIQKSLENPSASKNLPTNIPETSFYSDKRAPYLIVHGLGKVGQQVFKTMKSLGKAVNVKYIESRNLPIAQDSELNFLVKDVRTIVIVDDSVTKEKKGWFDMDPAEQTFVDSKALKRLLNSAINDRNKSGSQHIIKVVVLDKAVKQTKSAASFIVGETFDLSDDVILQSSQRSIEYVIVKVGKVIDDGTEIPSSVVSKTLSKVVHPSAAVAVTADEAKRLDQKSPMLFSAGSGDSRAAIVTRSRVDADECTRVSDASEAVMRGASSTLINSTSFSVLSTSTSYAGPLSDEVWNDELAKLIGPELHRIPLRFASSKQVQARMYRTLTRLQEPGSGLITPISIERFSNGIRLVFTPKDSGYVSSKEEKQEQEQLDSANVNIPAADVSSQKSGYLSPEREKELEEKAAAAAVSGAKSIVRAPKLTKPGKLEGGLEILVESVSAFSNGATAAALDSAIGRVRIRRCNMDKTTIVKEESESLIVDKLLQAVKRVEVDYKLMLLKGDEALEGNG